MWARAALRPCAALEPESSSPRSIPSTRYRQPWKVRAEGGVKWMQLTEVSARQRRAINESWPRRFQWVSALSLFK